MAEQRKPTQRYLSGRTKVTSFAGLHTDRHLYVHPGEVEPNLGYPGEKSIPISNTYYRLVTIDGGGPYDRYWQAIPPATLVSGISIFDEGNLVGTANSVSKINFVGAAISATASGTISTVTVQVVSISTAAPAGSKHGDLWWDSDEGELNVYYNDGNSSQWVLANSGISSGPQGGVGGQGGAGGANVTIGSTAPSNASSGDLWWDDDIGELFIYYDDNSGIPSAQWVEASSGSNTVNISDTAPPSPNNGDLWWESDTGTLKIYYQDADGAQWVDSNSGILQNMVNYWQPNFLGIHTAGNVGIGTTLATDKLFVGGNAIITGILTVGTSSLTLDGDNNVVNVGTALTLGHTQGIQFYSQSLHSAGFDVNNINASGIVTAASFYGDGSNLTGVGGTVAISTTAPSAPDVGDLWWDSDTGKLAIYYQDINSSQWVTASGNSGPAGPAGAQGAAGAAGAQGAQGHQGLTGSGAQGATGSSGAQGSIGSTGAQGATGSGAQGAAGAQGAQGHQGATGNTGAQGTAGAQGATGSTGAQGATGSTGAQGNAGSTGAQGHQGQAGTNAGQGAQGAAGAQGHQGNTGSGGGTGAQGAQGHQGNTGSGGGTGAQGATGSTGAQGSQGHQGGLSTYAVPQGFIGLWSGAANAIPTGWVLCDGQNNTPDLRNRFVVGAGSGYSVGNTGGSADATLVSHSHTINNHTHSFSGTTNDPGNHHHDVDTRNEWSSTHGDWTSGTGYRQEHHWASYYKPETSDAGGHTHTVSGTTGNPSDTGTNSQGSSATNANLPPYYALCYIMKT